MSLLFPDASDPQESAWFATIKSGEKIGTPGWNNAYEANLKNQSPVTYGALDEAIQKAIAAQSLTQTYQPTPYQNPNSLIPSQYMFEQGGQQSSEDSFAPMRAFQNYRSQQATGSALPPSQALSTGGK